MTKRVYNLDIQPRDETMALFPSLRSLFLNNALREQFDAYETKAIKGKKRYSFWIRAGVILIGIGIFATSCLWLVDNRPLEFRILASLTSAVGMAGIIIELIVLVRGFKSRWLLDRFAAEIIRSYVAQLYALGACAEDEADLASKAEKFSQERLAELRGRLNTGASAYRRFEPLKSICLPKLSGEPNSQIFAECRHAYQSFRVDFQEDFVQGELDKLENSRRVENSAADFLFVVGAILAVPSLGIPLITSLGGGMWPTAIAIAGALVFYVSAVSAILGITSSSHASFGRYATYLNYIKSLPDYDEDSPEAFLNRVERMELEALRELDAFCLQIDSSDIRL